MKLHEYQSKLLFSKYGVPIPEGRVAATASEAKNIADELGGRVVIKAQVLVGGRGKAGGIRLAKSSLEAEELAAQVLGMKIKDLPVRKVLIDQAVDIKSEIEKLRREILKMTDKEVIVDIKEIRRPEIDAQLVAENVAQQLERRIAFRRAMKKSVGSALKSGAKGIRIATAGRLGGAEMARREWYREGRVPLHTLRADIDYGFAQASTTYGVIGIKVWIYRGEARDIRVPEGAIR